MNHFIEEFLVLDYEKIEQNILRYYQQNEKYYDKEDALSALTNYQSQKIDFSELNYAVEEAYENSETRKHFGIEKSINIIDEIEGLSFPDIGKDVLTQVIGLDAVAVMKSNIGKVEACIRSGAYFEHGLNVRHFEEFGQHPSYSEEGLELYFKVVLEKNKACLQVEVMNGFGRTAKELPLTNEEIRSLHKLIIKEAEKDNSFAYRLGLFYLHDIAQSPEYKIIDDSTEYKHGLTLIEYKDSFEGEVCREETIDLDHPEEYLPIGFPHDFKEEKYMYTSFEELYKDFPEERDKMSFDEELAFVEGCYDVYESTGFCEKFDTPYEEGSEYNGMKFTVDRRVGYVTDDVDLECLPMWHITFENGIKLMAHPEEICKIEIEERNKGKHDRPKTQEASWNR